MKTKTIFKMLAAAMLMPTMLLTTACSNNDDEIVNTENPASTKGYALPVTVNVSRQGDKGSNRASYNESTRELSFSTGDKLFVTGNHYDADQFAGTLDYDAVSGKFSGTIYTESEYTGTIDDLMASARAVLLPADYGSYGFLSIDGSGSDATVDFDFTKTFALTKAAAVEQFSVEQTFSYSSGFALDPSNAIVSFTISGLTANKEVAVSFNISLGTISGNVTTSATGVATFAVGVSSGQDLEDCTLTVDGNNIAMPTATTVPGHIYNISRSVAPAVPALNITSPSVGQVIGSDGKNYAYGSLPTGVTAVAKICYVSGSSGLALALTDEGMMNWSTAQTTCAAHTPAFTGGTWKLASMDEWDNMISAAGSYTDLRDGFSSVGGSNMNKGDYWSFTEDGKDYAKAYYFGNTGGGGWFSMYKTSDGNNVRACLAF